MKKILTNLKRLTYWYISYDSIYCSRRNFIFNFSYVKPDGATAPSGDSQYFFFMAYHRLENAGLTLYIPILGGYIAYSIADRPGLAPGMCGAWLLEILVPAF